MDGPSWSNQTISCLNPYPGRTKQTLLHGSNAWCYACKDMTSQSITAQARKWSYQVHSLNSVPGQARLSIGYHYPSCPHNTNLQGSFPASLHQWSRNESSHWPYHYWLAWGHQGDPSSPHPYWQHRETLTIKDGLVLWGEALIIPPAKRERVLHELH